MHPGVPEQPSDERRTKPFARLRSFVARMFAAGGVAVTLSFFGVAGYDYYAYLVGTPTQAEVVSCVGERVGFACTVTWDAAGQSHVEKLEGTATHRHDHGSHIDIRVHHDKAFVAFSGVIWAGFGLLFAVTTAVGVAKFASEEWWDPWLERRPKWFQRVARFARGLEDDDGAGWF